MAWKKVTRRSTSIRVMEENKHLTMEEVLPIIVEESHKAGFLDFDLKVAGRSYRFLVREKMAPGVIPEKAKKADAEPEIKVE